MALLTTDAVILQLRDYLESSRLVRLATRDAGIVSAIARGARRQRGKSGSPLDLFARGTAHIHVRPTRDLQTLGGFEVGQGRAGFASDLDRFLAASAVAEVALAVLHEEANEAAFDVLAHTLDELGSVPASHIDTAALGGIWRLVATLGFAPSLDLCAACHARVDGTVSGLYFSPAAGGVLCASCVRTAGSHGARRLEGAGRTLPPGAWRRLADWLADMEGEMPDPLEIKAHRRLLREFLDAHLTGGTPLRAWEVWSAGGWPV